MQRINTAYFYLLASKLIPLKTIEGDKPIIEVYGELHAAEEELEPFLFNDLVPPVNSFSSAQSLLNAVKHLTENFWRDEPISWPEAKAVTDNLTKFEISLQSDFGIRDTFILSPKGAYSTTILAERGEAVLSAAVYELAPTLRQDVHDGCRCLAFELPTAAAFHFFRAAEAMAKAYGEYVRVKQFTEREKKGGLGSYANCLKQADLCVDRRIINSLEQLAGLHRNPTMHPEMHISKTEIMATLGMVVSVVEALTIDWNRRKTTPETSLAELLPDDSKVNALLEDGNEETPVSAGAIRSSDEADTVHLKRGTSKKPRRRTNKNESRKEEGSA